MNKTLQLVLAILLFVALAPMPYAYFEFLRIAVVVFFSLGALHAHREGHSGMLFFSLFIVVLFQPFFKIALGRVLWNVVDVVLGIYLLVDLVKNKS